MDHPNIIKIYETFEDSNSYYVVTEYFCDLLIAFVKVGSYSIDYLKLGVLVKQMPEKFLNKFYMQLNIVTLKM